MKIEYQESFINAAKAAHEITETTEIDDYPFPIKDVIKSDTSVELYTYNEFSNITGATKKEITKGAGTEEAFHIKKGSKKAIIYNEEKYDRRIRFSLAHEYGHLKMRHNGTNFMSFEKTDRIVNLEEYEANTFASCLLFPLSIRHEFHDVMDIEEISDLFKISYSAADVAMDVFNTHMENGLDEYISIFEHKKPSTYISFLENLYKSKLEYVDELKREICYGYSG